jgi:hypothetical protein
VHEAWVASDHDELAPMVGISIRNDPGGGHFDERLPDRPLALRELPTTELAFTAAVGVEPAVLDP